MDKETAKKVFDRTQDCLRLMNGMLVETEQSIPKAEYAKLRLTTANAMASVIDICEFHVYPDYPDLRPYSGEEKHD